MSTPVTTIHNFHTVAIQTYIAKLKSTIEDLETEVLKAKNGGDDDAHAHYHG